MLTGNPFFLHILVNIPQDGSDLAIYPKNFTRVYLIAYGVVSKVSNLIKTDKDDCKIDNYRLTTTFSSIDLYRFWTLSIALVRLQRGQFIIPPRETQTQVGDKPSRTLTFAYPTQAKL